VRLLVCGTRLLTGPEGEAEIDARLAKLPPGSTVIHGAAPGVDKLADRLARARGLGVEPYPANWKKHGKAAGPIRNEQMRTVGRPGAVAAFHFLASLGRGTADMVARARAAGLPVEVEILPPLTHATEGVDRRWRWCRCSVCQLVVVCEPSFDFYGDDGKPLVCERCFQSKVLGAGLGLLNFPKVSQ
jgi:hypothetical protein